MRALCSKGRSFIAVGTYVPLVSWPSLEEELQFLVLVSSETDEASVVSASPPSAKAVCLYSCLSAVVRSASRTGHGTLGESLSTSRASAPTESPRRSEERASSSSLSFQLWLPLILFINSHALSRMERVDVIHTLTMGYEALHILLSHLLPGICHSGLAISNYVLSYNSVLSYTCLVPGTLSAIMPRAHLFSPICYLLMLTAAG